MSKSTLAKPFTIAGFVLGELYMLYTVLAPNLKGVPVPLEATVRRILAMAVFFGPFGAAAGVGLWALGIALKQTFSGPSIPPEDEADPTSTLRPSQGAEVEKPGMP